MKNIASKLFSVTAVFLVGIAGVASSSASVFFLYEPECPEELLD